MVVNPKYKGIELPVSTWPQLDTYIPTGLEANDPCLAASPAPWLPQVASPVESMATITLELQFNISDSLVDCNNSFQFPSYTSVGQETPGQAFILGITSLADADQYGLETAALETQGGSTSDAKFSSGAGRTFVTPAVGSMRAALKLMTADKTAGSWSVPYAKLRSATAGKSAYPGTMLISTDVPTSRLAKPVAGDLGKFLTFVAGAGQHSGFGNGQLPPGYLPLTAANGAAKMVAYTKAAAADVTAQNGKVPALNGGQPGGRRPHSPSPSPTPSSGSTSGGSQPAPAPPPHRAVPRRRPRTSRRRRRRRVPRTRSRSRRQRISGRPCRERSFRWSC